MRKNKTDSLFSISSPTVEGTERADQLPRRALVPVPKDGTGLEATPARSVLDPVQLARIPLRLGIRWPPNAALARQERTKHKLAKQIVLCVGPGPTQPPTARRVRAPAPAMPEGTGRAVRVRPRVRVRVLKDGTELEATPARSVLGCAVQVDTGQAQATHRMPNANNARAERTALRPPELKSRSAARAGSARMEPVLASVKHLHAPAALLGRMGHRLDEAWPLSARNVLWARTGRRLAGRKSVSARLVQLVAMATHKGSAKQHSATSASLALTVRKRGAAWHLSA